MKNLILPALCLLLMGQDCDPVPPPVPPPVYCQGATGTWSQAKSGLSAIIGGYESGDRRATVRVQGNGYCTGTLLGPRTVLTAAHCKSETGYMIHASLDFNDPDAVPAAAGLPHPDYARWESNQDLEARKSDIMLIYASTDLPPPYATIYDPSDSVRCESMTAQGWGRTENGTPSRLMEVDQFRVSGDDEKTLYTKGAFDHEAICFGDSGGPLWAKVGEEYQVAGVTSTTWSADCLTKTDIASTHVKPSAFRDWIAVNMYASAAPQ